MKDNPEQHELWKDFVIFAKENGISLIERVDWQDWWDCFIAGSAAQFRLDMVGE